jgi:hypothetical protein
MRFKFAVPVPDLGKSFSAAQPMMSVAVPSELHANRVEAMRSSNALIALTSTGECPSGHVPEHAQYVCK